MWDPKTGDHLKAFEGHTQGVCAIAISPLDSNMLVSAAQDGEIRCVKMHGEIRCMKMGRSGE